MKRKISLLVAIIFFNNVIYDLYGCTSAIVTGKVTPDGRPLLWKHRDTGQEQNRVAFFVGEKYSFLGLVDSPSQGGEVWIGVNEVGFSIMNTASYNIQDKDDFTKDMDKEGELMFRALAICRNLSDFEFFLDTLSKPNRVEANFGVIDADGGAAFYEVNNYRYNKLDVNDPKVAPNGYLVVTNFSYTGRFNEGMGYIRQQTASELFATVAPTRSITPKWIVQNVSRSFYHSLLGIELQSKEFTTVKSFDWFIDQDFIPRKSTSASVVIQGVKQEENPELCVMWTLLGYPPASVMLPLWVSVGKNQPVIMLSSQTSQNSLICEWAVQIKHKTFPITRGNGSKYFKWSYIYNESGSGYMQILRPLEDEIFGMFIPKIDKWRENGKVDILDLSKSYSIILEKIGMVFKKVIQ